MSELYPEIEARAVYQLERDGHTIYFEETGNASGLPVIFLHGGPGSGCNENHRRYFNPDKYRIILLDQRGCRRSGPAGRVAHNTTQDILADMEAIRARLAIDQWALFGGSWGATLALLYAERYPAAVSGLISRGAFLARQCDFDWFARSGVNHILPDYWAEFTASFSEPEKQDLLSALYERVFSGVRDTQLAAARAWALWTGRVVTHNLMDAYALPDAEDEKRLHQVRIEMHYAKNRYFIAENQILADIARVPDVPIRIIHGRADLTCLPESSWAIHQGLAESGKSDLKLNLIPGTGHLAGESRMIDALVNATDELAGLLA